MTLLKTFSGKIPWFGNNLFMKNKIFSSSVSKSVHVRVIALQLIINLLLRTFKIISPITYQFNATFISSDHKTLPAELWRSSCSQIRNEWLLELWQIRQNHRPKINDQFDLHHDHLRFLWILVIPKHVWYAEKKYRNIDL